MKACFFGTYDKEYTRNRIFFKGLKKNNVEVIECNFPYPQVEGEVKGKIGFILYFSKLFFRQMNSYIKLFFAFFSKCRNCDVILVAYPWDWDMVVGKIISILTGKPIVFDIFVSKYNTFVLDRKVFPEKSFMTKMCIFMDRLSCNLSDKVLTETETQKKAFIELIGINESKLKAVYVGAESSLFYPRPEPKTDKFKVLFYGTHIPLQGVKFIVKAIKLLEKEKDIHFKVIGKGQTYDEVMQIASELKLKRTDFVDWVPYESLPKEVARADLCLGQFGETFKGNIVVCNKVFQAMAMEKPVINGEYSATKEFFKHKENIFLCKTSSEKAIAESILLLKKDKKLRNKIALNGSKLFKERFSEEAIGKELKGVLQEVINKR